jgi:pimeloyl-ACP methyl ester carboxylesterase
MGAPVERHVQRCAGVRLHWRECGAPGAPPLVLLHPSPRSSAMYEAWLPRLAALGFRACALDTPGYGMSDALPAPPAHLRDYLPVLRAWAAQALGGAAPIVYGSATGAQLAIAWALAHPGDVAHLLLDNAAHFDDAERATLLERYFPDLTPRADGSHLATAWQLATQMAQFFPWYAADEAHRVSTRVPTPAELHASALEFLNAGPGWAAAYRAAFEHERAAHVQALTVPTTLLHWAGSPIRKHIDRLLQHPLPDHVSVLPVPAPQDQRLATIESHLAAHLAALLRP